MANRFLIIFFLKFKVPPQILPFSFGEEISNAGDIMIVQCMVLKGDLPIEISWKHNEKILKSNENGIAISKISARVSSLNFENVDGYHRGNYTCVAMNMAGISEKSSQLNVNGSYYSHVIL